MARCEGDNRVTLLGPRPMNSMRGVNGHLPVKVQNQSHHCAYRYEGASVAPALGSGWGGGLVAFETSHRHALGLGSLGPSPSGLRV